MLRCCSWLGSGHPAHPGNPSLVVAEEPGGIFSRGMCCSCDCSKLSSPNPFSCSSRCLARLKTFPRWRLASCCGDPPLFLRLKNAGLRCGECARPLLHVCTKHMFWRDAPMLYHINRTYFMPFLPRFLTFRLIYDSSPFGRSHVLPQQPQMGAFGRCFGAAALMLLL